MFIVRQGLKKFFQLVELRQNHPYPESTGHLKTHILLVADQLYNTVGQHKGIGIAFDFNENGAIIAYYNVETKTLYVYEYSQKSDEERIYITGWTERAVTILGERPAESKGKISHPVVVRAQHYAVCNRPFDEEDEEE
jgi:hypothetical protein